MRARCAPPAAPRRRSARRTAAPEARAWPRIRSRPAPRGDCRGALHPRAGCKETAAVRTRPRCRSRTARAARARSAAAQSRARPVRDSEQVTAPVRSGPRLPALEGGTHARRRPAIGTHQRPDQQHQDRGREQRPAGSRHRARALRPSCDLGQRLVETGGRLRGELFGRLVPSGATSPSSTRNAGSPSNRIRNPPSTGVIGPRVCRRPCRAADRCAR